MTTAQIKEFKKGEKLAVVCKCSLTYSVMPTFSFSLIFKGSENCVVLTILYSYYKFMGWGVYHL